MTCINKKRKVNRIIDYESVQFSGVLKYTLPSQTPKPSYSRDPSPLCHRPGHNNQACTPATIKCGSEHVVLRSRLPRRSKFSEFYFY